MFLVLTLAVGVLGGLFAWKIKPTERLQAGGSVALGLVGALLAYAVAAAFVSASPGVEMLLYLVVGFAGAAFFVFLVSWALGIAGIHK